MTFEIPKPLQDEHEALHEQLRQATQAEGEVGTRAKTLASLMHPHFVKEDRIALPPLGLLGRWGAGRRRRRCPASLGSPISSKPSCRRTGGIRTSIFWPSRRERGTVVQCACASRACSVRHSAYLGARGHWTGGAQHGPSDTDLHSKGDRSCTQRTVPVT